MSKKLVVVLVGLVALRGILCLADEAVKRPELTPPKCDKAPVVDGDLTDAAWKKAKVVGDFYLWRGNGARSTNIIARVMRDDEWLYVAFEITRPHPEAIEPTVFDHDGNISVDDSVEVFIAPDATKKVYCHYMLNTVNARADRKCLNEWDKDLTWDLPWRSATKKTKTGWQAEIGIPLSVLQEEGDKDTQPSINLCANRVLVTLNFANVIVGNYREPSSWAPVKVGFHEPESFGLLEGVKTQDIETPFLVSEQSVKAGNYASDDDGKFYYEVTGVIRSYTDRAGKLSVVAEDKPATGKGESVTEDITIEKKGDVDFALKIPVTAFSGRTAEVSLRDPATGEILQNVSLRDMANLSLMRAYPRYSYYTSEKNADVACEIGLPPSELVKVKLVANDKSGKKLAETTDVLPTTLLPVPSTKLKLGANPVKVHLMRKSGDTLYSEEVTLVKRKPKPGCEWKLDLVNKVILNNGKPFFMFGVMTSGPTTTNAEVMVRDMADIGFNTICRFMVVPHDQAEELLEMGKKHNVYVVDFPAMTWRYKPSEEIAKKWDSMTRDQHWDWMTDNVWLPGVKKLMNHPNLVAWYLADEPQSNLDAAARILRLHKAIYEVDGYHPTEVLYIPPVPEGDVFSRNCDILGIDPYWVPGSGTGESGTPNSVGRQVWLNRRRADRDLKLLCVTPCLEFFSGTRMRIFTEKEQRVQTYLALIHGAKAFLYFRYPFLHQSSADTFKRLSEEMKIIGPARVAPDVEQTITYTPVAFDPYSNLFPDIQVRLLKNPAGGYILLAANYRSYPAEADFGVSLLEKGGKVRKLFEKNGAVAVKEGKFSDSFEAMDTRAYAIEGVPDAKAPVVITVKIASQPAKADPVLSARAMPTQEIIARKNILPNSGFEKCTIPGMPDYYTDFRTAKTGFGYRLGDNRGDPLVAVDTENPYEGKSCLRTTSGFFLFGTRLQGVPPGKYVISAYVRGTGDPSSEIGFYGCVDSRKFFPVTKEWQRISVTVDYPFKGEGDIFGFHIHGTNNVWIDAMQFEKGAKPTKYEP